MKALRFMKIDYIRTRQQMLFLPVIIFAVSAIMMGSGSGIRGGNVVPAFCYTIFLVIIFSTTPFGTCQRKDAGFLMMLPASTWDRVFGRFLYGISMMAGAVVVGVCFVLGYRAAGYVPTSVEVSLCLIGFAIAVLLMTGEYVFFYLFGENQSQNLLGIARVVPGMIFFFASSSLSSEIVENPAELARVMETVGSRLLLIGWVCAAASVIVLFAAILFCVRMTERRDY